MSMNHIYLWARDEKITLKITMTAMNATVSAISEMPYLIFFMFLRDTDIGGHLPYA